MTKALKTHGRNYGTATLIAVVLIDVLERYVIPADVPTEVRLAVHGIVQSAVIWTTHRAAEWLDGRALLVLLLAVAPLPADASPTRAVLTTRTATMTAPEFVDGVETGYVLEWEEEVPELFVDLSVSLDFFVIDLSTRAYRLGVSPGIGYGLKWAPAFWTLSDVFLALDVFVQAGVVESDATREGPDVFAIDVLPALIVADWVGVGFGARRNVSLQAGVDSATSPIFSFGIRKSL